MSSIYLIDYYANKKELPFQKMSVYFKLIFFVLTLFSIVTSNSLLILGVVIFTVYSLAVAGKLPFFKVFKWALYPTFFALIFAISQIGSTLAIRTLLRAFSAASLAIFFSFTTPYQQTFGIISKVSPFLGSLLFLTYRYLFMFISAIERKIKMVKIRGGGQKKIRSLGKIVGFFIISFLNRSENIYKILKIRGFKGKIGRTPEFKISFYDFFILTIGILIFLINYLYV